MRISLSSWPRSLCQGEAQAAGAKDALLGRGLRDPPEMSGRPHRMKSYGNITKSGAAKVKYVHISQNF